MDKDIDPSAHIGIGQAIVLPARDGVVIGGAVRIDGDTALELLVQVGQARISALVPALVISLSTLTGVTGVMRLIELSIGKYPRLAGREKISMAVGVNVNRSLVHMHLDDFLARSVIHGKLRSPDTADHPSRLDLKGGFGRSQFFYAGQQLAEHKLELQDLVIHGGFLHLGQENLRVGTDRQLGAIKEPQYGR